MNSIKVSCSYYSTVIRETLGNGFGHSSSNPGQSCRLFRLTLTLLQKASFQLFPLSAKGRALVKQPAKKKENSKFKSTLTLCHILPVTKRLIGLE